MIATLAVSAVALIAAVLASSLLAGPGAGAKVTAARALCGYPMHA